jgi:hypothetical protein
VLSAIEKIYSWDKTALAKVLEDAAKGKEIDYPESVKEEYTLKMRLYQYDTMGVNLHERKIHNTITLYAFNLICREYPLAFPVLLKYLIHNDLFKDAKNDLKKISQELQSVMDQDLKNLEEKLAQKDQLTKEDKSQFISETFEIASCQKYMKDLFNGKKVTKDTEAGTYSQKYYSMLESKLTEMMKEKINDYANDDDAIKDLYQSLSNKAEKVERLDCIIGVVLLTSALLTGAAYIATIVKAFVDENDLIFAMIIPSACILFIGLAIAGTVRSKRVDAKVSLANELEDYIVGPKCEEIHYPDLREMDVDGILGGKHEEVQSKMENPDPNKVGKDNVLNASQ